MALDKVEELTIVNKKEEKATWFKQNLQYKFDKEEEAVDFLDDFNHIGVRIDYNRMEDDLEEELVAAKYQE